MDLNQLETITNFFNGMLTKAHLEAELSQQYQELSSDTTIKDLLDNFAKNETEEKDDKAAMEPPPVPEQFAKNDIAFSQEEAVENAEAGCADEDGCTGDTETEDEHGSLDMGISDGIDFAKNLVFKDYSNVSGDGGIDYTVKEKLPSVNWGDNNEEEDTEEDDD